MRILITGGNGQLGREWVHFLNKQSVEFISLPSSDLDITDKEDMYRVLKNLKPDLIINCAAYTKVDDAEEEIDKAFQVNALAVKNIADYCSVHDIKLIHFSTDYVFPGSMDDLEQLPEGYVEDHPTDPINVYGESKKAGEDAILQSGCNYLIVRVSWLCGQYGNNFVKTMLKLSEGRDELQVVNDQVGCPTFTQNLVENCWILFEQKKKGIYHFSSLGKITWFEFAEEIFQQAGISIHLNPVESSQFPTKAKRPAFSLLSTQKISKIPGSTLIDWKLGLKNMLDEINK